MKILLLIFCTLLMGCEDKKISTRQKIKSTYVYGTRNTNTISHATYVVAKDIRYVKGYAEINKDLATTHYNNKFVGCVFKVGQFNWIDYLYGWSSDAQHFHEKYSDGSYDIGCSVRVLAHGQSWALVILLRKKLPYGAQASHGTIFAIRLSEILGWKSILAQKREIIAERELIMSNLYLKNKKKPLEK